jgi:hypothetical protein
LRFQNHATEQIFLALFTKNCLRICARLTCYRTPFFIVVISFFSFVNKQMVFPVQIHPFETKIYKIWVGSFVNLVTWVETDFLWTFFDFLGRFSIPAQKEVDGCLSQSSTLKSQDKFLIPVMKCQWWCQPFFIFT